MSNGKKRRLEIISHIIYTKWNIMLNGKKIQCHFKKNSNISILYFINSPFFLFYLSCPSSTFFSHWLFSSWRFILSIDVLSMSAFFTVDIISNQRFFTLQRFVPVDVCYILHFFQSTFFTFQHFVPVNVFYFRPFVPVGVFSGQRFVQFSVFSFNVLSIEVFY